MAAKLLVKILIFLHMCFVLDAITHYVKLNRQSKGDMFSSTKLNCNAYGAKQISPSKCQCVSTSKDGLTTIPGTLYQDGYGYTRCFYDNGASFGCFSPSHYFEPNTIRNSTDETRLVFDESRYTSFIVFNASGLWGSNGTFLMLLQPLQSVRGNIYFLKLKLISSRNGTQDTEICATLKIAGEKSAIVRISSMEVEVPVTEANNEKLFMYTLIAVGITLVLLVVALTRSVVLNRHYHRLLWLGKKVLAEEKPLGTASKYYTESDLFDTYKQLKRDKKKNGNVSAENENVHIVIENENIEREEPEGSVKTVPMLRLDALGQSTKKVPSPAPSKRNVLLPTCASLSASKKLPMPTPSSKVIDVPLRSEHKIDGEEHKANEEESLYEVDSKIIEADYENVENNVSDNRNDEYTSQEQAGYEVGDPDLKSGVVTDYEVVDHDMEEEPYLKMYEEPYLAPIEMQYQNLGENSNSRNDDDDDDDAYDYSLNELSKIKQYR